MAVNYLQRNGHIAKKISCGSKLLILGEIEMSDNVDEKTETYSCSVEELSGHYDNNVTVKIDKWFYYVDRAKLMLIEGTYSKEDLEKAAERCNHIDILERAGESPDVDCPRHFTVVCRPLDLVRLAKAILKFYREYQDIY
jgi:hypothetical protein